MISMTRAAFQMGIPVVMTRLPCPVATVALRALSTSLHDIVRRGDLSQLKEALEKASIEEINSPDPLTGELPLTIAFKQCVKDVTYPHDVVPMLIHRRACVLRQGKDGKAPVEFSHRVKYNLPLISQIEFESVICDQVIYGCDYDLSECSNCKEKK